MKRSFLSLAAIGIIVLIAASSCKKNNNTQSTTINTPALNQLFAALRDTPQSINVTAGRDTMIYGANGTLLHFYNNSFKDANNNIINSGTINLQLTEMYKAGDIISNRATTIAGSQMLQSGGEVYISATLNGQQVLANKYGIGFKQPAQSGQPMALFYGAANNADSVITWAQSDTTLNGTKTNATIKDSVRGYNMYLFDSCTNFSWANCDWFYSSDSPKVSVSVILPDTSFNPTNTQLYIVLPNVDQQTIVLGNVEDLGVGSSSYTAATNTFMLVNEGSTAIVPSGMAYELVVITNKNGVYYYYKQSGTIPQAALTATAAMAQDTEQDIKTKLAAL